MCIRDSRLSQQRSHDAGNNDDRTGQGSNAAQLSGDVYKRQGLWVPSLLAAFSVYSTMEKNLHLEERIQDIKNY